MPMFDISPSPVSMPFETQLPACCLFLHLKQEMSCFPEPGQLGLPLFI